MRIQLLLGKLALGLAAAALVFGLSTAPRAAAADDRLQFSGTTLSGAPFNGAALQGKRAVLWFWTPWCPFCNAEAPGVSRVAAANPGVTFVGVADDELASRRLLGDGGPLQPGRIACTAAAA